MTAFYNDSDPYAVHRLRQNIAHGLIAPGVVDGRSIKEIDPNELEGFTQVHLFAGLGIWSYAARRAGWPDTRPLWTGSCPCQPFSEAGKRAGTDDPRHLWPDMLRLIRARRPADVMGEQVAGSLGYGWFDGVQSDLEAEGYASRAVDFPACSVDAPQVRNRLYWTAKRMAGAHSGERDGRPIEPERGSQGRAAAGWPAARIVNGSFWADAEWITCHDGKARRTKPGLRLLVNGYPTRISEWRATGNAISPEAAIQVIAAYLETEAAITAAA